MRGCDCEGVCDGERVGVTVGRVPVEHTALVEFQDPRYRNPSAKFMSLANNLSTSMRQRMPMGMWPMTGMMMGGYPQMGGCSSMDYPQGMWPAHAASGR